MSGLTGDNAGRMPVLLVIGHQEPLLESAMAVRDGREPTIPLEAARLPPGVEIDPNFAAVPVGSAEPGLESAESVRPETSEKFVVRALVDTRQGVPERVDGAQVFSQPRIEALQTCIGSPANGDAARVRKLLNGSKLKAMGLTGKSVAIAIADTGINLQHLKAKIGKLPAFDAANSWTLPTSTSAPGKYPVNHGTMCAYDALIMAPSATLIDVPILRNASAGGSSMAGTLAAALQAYAHLLARRSVSFAAGDLGKYAGLVINNSWGVYDPSWDFPAGHPGRYIDNPRHPFNLLVGVMAISGIDMVFAAGNCGADCPDGRCSATTETIMGANALGDVLTVGGCDVGDVRVGYSSQGPSIAGMMPNKPDITAYTHFLGSEAFGGGVPDSGTSTACPVVAGCLAAIRTKLPHTTTPPSSLISNVHLTARAVGGQSGWNADYGHGILDPLALAQSLGL